MHEGIAITKDLFLLVIQDRGVQQLMDELDLPPDRANLFEIIDADAGNPSRIFCNSSLKVQFQNVVC